MFNGKAEVKIIVVIAKSVENRNWWSNVWVEIGVRCCRFLMNSQARTLDELYVDLFVIEVLSSVSLLSDPYLFIYTQTKYSKFWIQFIFFFSNL